MFLTSSEMKKLAVKCASIAAVFFAFESSSQAQTVPPERSAPQLKTWFAEAKKKPRAKQILAKFPRVILGLQEKEGSAAPEVINFAATQGGVFPGNSLKILNGNDVQLSVILNAEFSNSSNNTAEGKTNSKSTGEEALAQLRGSVDFQSVIVFPKPNAENNYNVTIEFQSEFGKAAQVKASAPDKNWNRSEFVSWYYKSLGMDGVVIDKNGPYLLVVGNEQNLIPGSVGYLLEKNSAGNDGLFRRGENQEPNAFLKVIQGKSGYAVAQVFPNNGKIEVAVGSYLVVPKN
jgi:hypothetical protein